MKNKSKFSLDLISRYRNELYGVFIIQIIIFHYFLKIRQSGSGMLFEVARCYDIILSSVGVDCFMLLSGMGLYYSMSNNRNIKQFYIKRFKRVFVPYAVWGCLFWIVQDLLVKGKGIGDFLYDFSFLSFWFKGDRVLWYIALTLILYLLFPFIFNILESGRYRFLRFAAMAAVFAALNVALKLFLPVAYDKIEIAVSRIPVFLFGVYMGKRIKQREPFGVFDMVLSVIAACVSLFGILQRYNVISVSFDFGRYEFSLLAVFLIYLLVWLFSMVKSSNIILAFLKKVGTISLELYMTHVCIINIMVRLDMPLNKIYYYAICIVLSVILSILLHFALKNVIIKIK